MYIHTYGYIARLIVLLERLLNTFPSHCSIYTLVFIAYLVLFC